MNLMPVTSDPSRDLLFGLLALQIGLIDQGALFAAFAAWARDKARPLADHLIGRGDLDAEQRGLLEGLVAQHLKKHGGSTEKSLAAIPAGRSTREGLARVGDADIEGSLARIGPVSTRRQDDADCTASYSVGTATSEGQRFRVLRPHATGGLGAVFVALDVELHREVALKQILAGHADDDISRQRFLLEAEITGGLEHPGILPVYGLGTYADGRPFYAMRFIRGDSLKEAIDRFLGGPTHRSAGSHSKPSTKKTRGAGASSLAFRQLLRRFLDVCNAIEYAHSRGVLHRDIKPANIILGKHGETLVVDWGLAKATGKSDPVSGERTLLPSSSSGSSETLPGSALGTPAYMSPEQAEGDMGRLGRRSDVYSLGATLYCILTGGPPFAGDAADVIRRVGRGDFRPPRALDPQVDRALEAVCLKAMAIRPENRYGSPKELAEDVERWMADEPVTAWREPLARRARRWARRNLALMTAAAAVVVVALAGLGAVLAVEARANDRLWHANARLATANAEVRRVNSELEAANGRERQRFDLALDAIRRYHSGVSEDFMLTQDQLKDLRDRLLRDALEFYRKLERLLSGHSDTESRRALGRAYAEVGELTDKIGSIPDALVAHRKALKVRRALADELASEPNATAQVGRSLIAIGVLLTKLNQCDLALASQEEARSVLSKLTGSGRDRNAALGDIALSYYWTGVIRRRNGQVREAMAALERAREIAAELTAAHRDSVNDERTLAWCYNNIGLIRLDEGDTAAALAAYERSRRIKQKIAEEHPSVAEYRRDVASSYMSIGSALRESGRPAEALASHRAAERILRSLLDTYPAVSLLQSNLANCLDEIGDVLRLVDHTAEARESYDRALSILDALARANPMATEDQSYPMLGIELQGLKGLAATQVAAGQIAEAVASCRRAIAKGGRLRSGYGEAYYYLAKCHALLGGTAGKSGSGLSANEGASELDKAMEVLRRAVAAGYHPFHWMQRDLDLDALRPRPDFQLLMMDLAFPADPVAHGD
jgi:serine/threonine-protein kinase